MDGTGKWAELPRLSQATNGSLKGCRWEAIADNDGDGMRIHGKILMV